MQENDSVLKTYVKKNGKTANAPEIIFLFSLAVTHQFTDTDWVSSKGVHLMEIKGNEPLAKANPPAFTSVM